MTKLSQKIDTLLHKSTTPEKVVQRDKEQRENRSEKAIDKELKDSFPASDPPGNY